MKPQILLSDSENREIERILAVQTAKAKHTITLPYLMDEWSQFVLDVENGYQLTIDDYTNSLSVRNLFQEILETCPQNLSLKEWISEWDNRFATATEAIRESLLPRLDEKTIGWWWFRIPTNPGTELKKWFQITKLK